VVAAALSMVVSDKRILMCSMVIQVITSALFLVAMMTISIRRQPQTSSTPHPSLAVSPIPGPSESV
jgi:hypothetical protein